MVCLSRLYTSRLSSLKNEDLSIVCVFCFIGFSVEPTLSGSYGDFQLLLVEEDPTGTNIEIFACIGRTPTHRRSAGRPPIMKVSAPTGTRTHAVRGRVVTNQRFRPLDHRLPLIDK